MFNFQLDSLVVPRQPVDDRARFIGMRTQQLIGWGQGDTPNIPDPSKIANPDYWTKEELAPIDNYQAYWDLKTSQGASQSALSGTIAALGGAVDPSKAILFRSLLGAKPMQPMKYSPSELTAQWLESDRKDLATLLKAEAGDVPADPNNLTANQKKIKELGEKLLYADSMQVTDADSKFSWFDYMPASGTVSHVFASFVNLLSGQFNPMGALAREGSMGKFADSGKLDDVKEVLMKNDPDFDPGAWFNEQFKDPWVLQSLAENGITAETVAGSPNADNARFRVASALMTTTTADEIAKYSGHATWLRDVANDLAVFAVNTPDIPALLVGEVALNVLLPVVGTVGGAALGAARLGKAFEGVRMLGRAGEAAIKLPLGSLPNYVHTSSSLSQLGWTVLGGAVANSFAEVQRQRKELAWGLATRYAQADAMRNYDANSVLVAAAGGAAFGGLFWGLGYGLKALGGSRSVSTTATDFIGPREFIGPRPVDVVGDLPADAKVAVAAVLGEKPMDNTQVAHIHTHEAEKIAVENSAVNTESVVNTPDDITEKRVMGESREDYAKRIGQSKSLKNMWEFVTEVARKVADKDNKVFLGSSDVFSSMSKQDQIRVLHDSKKYIAQAAKVEEQTHGLSKDRYAAVAAVESQRAKAQSVLMGQLTKVERKLLRDELNGKPAKPVIKALEDARNMGLSATERQAAAEAVAASVLESARESSAAAERGPEAATPASVGPERTPLAALPDELKVAHSRAKLEASILGEISENLSDDTARMSMANDPVVDRVVYDMTKEGLIASAVIDNLKSPDAVKLMTKVAKNPDKFVDILVDVGYPKERVEYLFEYVKHLRDNVKVLSAEEAHIFLVAASQFDFNSTMFADLKYDTNMDIDVNWSGQYHPGKNSITIAPLKVKKGEGAVVLLHEFTHAFIRFNADNHFMVNMFETYLKETQRVFVDSSGKYVYDPLMKQTRGYFLGNPEEWFVESMAHALFDEATAIMRSNLIEALPKEPNGFVSAITNLGLNKIHSLLIRAADVINTSKAYTVIKQMMDTLFNPNIKQEFYAGAAHGRNQPQDYYLLDLCNIDWHESNPVKFEANLIKELRSKLQLVERVQDTAWDFYLHSHLVYTKEFKEGTIGLDVKSNNYSAIYGPRELTWSPLNGLHAQQRMVDLLSELLTDMYGMKPSDSSLVASGIVSSAYDGISMEAPYLRANKRRGSVMVVVNDAEFEYYRGGDSVPNLDREDIRYSYDTSATKDTLIKVHGMKDEELKSVTIDKFMTAFKVDPLVQATLEKLHPQASVKELAAVLHNLLDSDKLELATTGEIKMKSDKIDVVDIDTKIEALAQGHEPMDHDMFTEVLTEYATPGSDLYKKVFFGLKKVITDPEVRSDLMQDAYVKLLTALNENPKETLNKFATEESIGGYLRTVVKNAFLDMQKKTAQGDVENVVAMQATDGNAKDKPVIVDRVNTEAAAKQKQRESQVFAYTAMTDDHVFFESLSASDKKLITTVRDGLAAGKSWTEIGGDTEVARSTANRRARALLAKYHEWYVRKQANPELTEVVPAKKLKEAKTKLPKEAKSPAKPKPSETAKAAEQSTRLLRAKELAERLKNANNVSDAEVTPVLTTEKPTGLMDTKTGVVRKPKQSKIVVDRDPEHEVVAVVVDADKESTVKVNAENPESYVAQNGPSRFDDLKKLAERRNKAALEFNDGSIVPLKKPKVVGRKVSKKKPEAVQGATKPATKVVVTDVPTVVEERVPNVADPMVDHGPREFIGPYPKVEPTTSDVPELTPEKEFEHSVMDEPDMARLHGIDSSTLRNFTKAFHAWVKDTGALTLASGDVYPKEFHDVWAKFVHANSAIMSANIKLFGEEMVGKFWNEVNRLVTADILKMTTVPDHKMMSTKKVYELAAKSLGLTDWAVPMVPEDIKFIKTDTGSVDIVGRTKYGKAALGNLDAEPVVLGPPKPTELGEAPPIKMLEPDNNDPKIKDLVRQSINRRAGYVLFRNTNIVGAVFGGNNRAVRGWYRKLLTSAANLTQSATRMGDTVRSLSKTLAAASRFFDDTRATTGALIGAGKEAFKTALECKSIERATLQRVFEAYSDIRSWLGNNPRNDMLDAKVFQLLSEGKDITKGDISALGYDPKVVDELHNKVTYFMDTLRRTYGLWMELQDVTGIRTNVDENGLPIDPRKFAPVQFDHEKMTTMLNDPTQVDSLLQDMVDRRRARKLASKKLDKNTMVVLGWLDVRPSREAKGTDLFAKDREFKQAAGSSGYSQETLDKLKIGEFTTDTDAANWIDRHHQAGKYFVGKIDDDRYGIYKVPVEVEDLAQVDQDVYKRALQGDQSVYADRWREYLKGKDLIHAEMQEMIEYKTKTGKYALTDRGLTRPDVGPVMRIGETSSDVGLAIPGITPEEILMKDGKLNRIIRFNMAEATGHLMHGRLFELMFQRELDRELGMRGITARDWLKHIHVIAQEEMTKIAQDLHWTQEETDVAIQSIHRGYQRLIEEYEAHAETLPRVNDPANYASRLGLALIRLKTGSGQGLAAMTEVVQQLFKSDVTRVPAELMEGIRWLIGDRRFSKNASLKSAIGDMMFANEMHSVEMQNRFLGEAGQGTYESDNSLAAKFINSNPAIGTADRLVRGVETAGKVSQELGSLQQVTAWARSIGKANLMRDYWKVIRNGGLVQLIEALNTPENQAILKSLNDEAVLSPSGEKKLWNKFVSLARQNKFGGDPYMALDFLKFGLNTADQLKHLEWMISKVGDSQGRVDIRRMYDLVLDLENNPVAGIDPNVAANVIERYRYMLETLINKRVTTEGVGLNRITNPEAQTGFGRLYYALSSWIRSYQDNQVMAFGERQPLKYVLGALVMFGLFDAINGLFREWVAGRDGQDIADELEHEPQNIALRMARSTPLFGAANAYLEATLGLINQVSGGSWKYWGTPGSSIGGSVASSAMDDLYTSPKNIIKEMMTPTQDSNLKILKELNDITGVNALVNKSPTAIPVRVLESLGAIDQRGAVGKYLNLAQREERPWAKARRSTTGRSMWSQPQGGNQGINPRNDTLDNQAIIKERAKQVVPSLDNTTLSDINNNGPSKDLSKHLKGII